MHKARLIEGRGFGDASVLHPVEADVPAPRAGEILVRQHAVGVNFIDILQRRGDLGKALPFGLGLEAAGEVIAIGEGVSEFASGNRIVYAGGPMGAYADLRVLPAARAVGLPARLGFEEAAAVFFKGLTADYLVNRLRPIAEGDVVLFHGAGGGVASLAVPLLKRRGAVVIGTVGRAEKRDFAAGLGCDHVAVLGVEDVPGLAKRVTAGEGVAIVFDPVGRSTFELSLACLARFGLFVSYGWASGDVDPVPLSKLRDAGSLFMTRPTVSHYTERRADLLAGAKRLFAAIEEGIIVPHIHASLPLGRAGDAHGMLEAGANRGAVVLLPSAER